MPSSHPPRPQPPTPCRVSGGSGLLSDSRNSRSRSRAPTPAFGPSPRRGVTTSSSRSEQGSSRLIGPGRCAMRPRRSRGTLPDRNDRVRGAYAPRGPEIRVPDPLERTTSSKCCTAASPWDGAGAGIVSEAAAGCRPCETRTRSLCRYGSAPMTPPYFYSLTFVVDEGKYDSRMTNLPV
jgi:hypothetical protein